MDTHAHKQFAQNPLVAEAKEIIRKCVHCGFCLATCPTYQLLGEESDSPRGRIYLIKQMLESGEAGAQTRRHLDRCLSCRACETNCPSGVQYVNLLEIGKTVLEEIKPRNPVNTLRRKMVAKTLAQGPIINTMVKLASRNRNFLPQSIQKQLPAPLDQLSWPAAHHQRKMMVLTGCVQPSLSPETNLVAAQVLDQLGISLLKETAPGCCGAVGLHTSDHKMGLRHIRQRIDYWWPYIESGLEAIVFCASGCGITIKDYAHLLKDDTAYAEKAQRVSGLSKDLSQIIHAERHQLDPDKGCQKNIVFHPPCTLQHGLKLAGVVEDILTASGYQLLPFKDAHICCGSAGTYSIFQANISNRLRDEKLQSLQLSQPKLIATANVGCQYHLKTKSEVKVVHWIELLL